MEAPDREAALKTGKLVLVAEDHSVNQELIQHQLSLLGLACDVVHDGIEALATLDRTRYGFLITNCHMPNMTGYELAKRVRASEQGSERHLPILGHGEHGSRGTQKVPRLRYGRLPDQTDVARHLARVSEPLVDVRNRCTAGRNVDCPTKPRRPMAMMRNSTSTQWRNSGAAKRRSRRSSTPSCHRSVTICRARRFAGARQS